MENTLSIKNNILFDVIFDYPLVYSKSLIKFIDKFCSNSHSLKDLFISKFCFALANDLILLENYNDEYSVILNQNVLGFGFVNHKHRFNENLKELLYKHRLHDQYVKYCQYLNKLVFNIIIHYDVLVFEMSEYPQKLSSKVQNQILNLKRLVENQYILSKYSLQTYLKNVEYSTKDLLEFLRISLLEFKIDIGLDRFNYIIDKIKPNGKEVNTRKWSIVKKHLGDFELLIKHVATTLTLFKGIHCSIYSNTISNSFSTIFNYAAHMGVLEMLIILIENGVDVNCINLVTLLCLSTAIMSTAHNGQVDCLFILIENGANLNAWDNSRKTALIYAAQNGNLNCLLTLIENRANLNIQDIEGKTALMYAAERGCFECLSKLVEAGANIDIQDKVGKNTLMYAAKKGHLDCLLKLIESGANLNTQCKIGWTALIYAVQCNHLDCLKILIESSAKVDIQAKNGKTALMYAVQSRRTDCLKILIENKADLDIQDKDGWTALMYAVREGHYDCVNFLIENKANSELQSNNGETALSIADNLF